MGHVLIRENTNCLLKYYKEFYKEFYESIK